LIMPLALLDTDTLSETILKRRGELISDADLIIAATAITHGLVLVTTNTAHYRRITGLVLDRWTQP
jgi:tRNA(fMet)-specific endonuclease VapC